MIIIRSISIQNTFSVGGKQKHIIEVYFAVAFLWQLNIQNSVGPHLRMCSSHTFNGALCPAIPSLHICHMSLAWPCCTQTASQCLETKSDLKLDGPEWFSKIWAVFTVHLAIWATINNGPITKHKGASFPSFQPECGIQHSKCGSNSPARREACITTPSKQGSPTGRAPFCPEQGRVSLPRSHWSIPVLLFSDWSKPVIDSRLDSREGQSV